jgi:hypothetical protein
MNTYFILSKARTDVQSMRETRGEEIPRAAVEEGMAATAAK